MKHSRIVTLLVSIAALLSNSYALGNDSSSKTQDSTNIDLNESNAITTKVVCAPFKISIQAIRVSCIGLSDGQIRIITISGAVGPYDIQVDGGPSQTFMGSTLVFPNLAAGPHTITVTDNLDCQTEIPAFIPNPPPTTVAFTPEPVTCPGGTDGQIIVNSVNGGTPPNEVRVDDGSSQVFSGSPLFFPNLAQGNHTIIVEDRNSCITEIPTFIESPDPIKIIFSTKRACPGCTDGKIIVSSISGGTPPYEVQVDQGTPKPFTGESLLFSCLTAGSHTITVTDSNNCTSSFSAFICPCKK